MAEEPKDTEKLKKVVNFLAGENCGKCGFQNCGEFAVALVEGKASPVDCRKSLDNLKEIVPLHPHARSTTPGTVIHPAYKRRYGVNE